MNEPPKKAQDNIYMPYADDSVDMVDIAEKLLNESEAQRSRINMSTNEP